MEAPQGRSERQPPAVWEELKSKNKTLKPPPEVMVGAQGTRITGGTRSAREPGRAAAARSRPNRAGAGKGLRRPGVLGQLRRQPKRISDIRSRGLDGSPTHTSRLPALSQGLLCSVRCRAFHSIPSLAHCDPTITTKTVSRRGQMST